MYIAYSALLLKESFGQNPDLQPENQLPAPTDNELLIRYRAYQATCDKYNREITAIQKYIPGWQPKFYSK